MLVTLFCKNLCGSTCCCNCIKIGLGDVTVLFSIRINLLLKFIVFLLNVFRLSIFVWWQVLQAMATCIRMQKGRCLRLHKHSRCSWIWMWVFADFSSLRCYGTFFLTCTKSHNWSAMQQSSAAECTSDKLPRSFVGGRDDDMTAIRFHHRKTDQWQPDFIFYGYHSGPVQS